MMSFVQHSPGCPALGRKSELEITSPKGHVRRKSLGDERWPRTITGEDKRIAPNTGSLGSNKANKEKQVRHGQIKIPKIVVTPPRGYPSRVYNGRGGTGLSSEDYDLSNSGWRWANSNKDDLISDRRKSFDSWPLGRGLSTNKNNNDNNNSAEYWSFRRPSFDVIPNKRVSNDVISPRKSNIASLPYKRLSGESWSYVLQKDEFGKYVMTRRPYATSVHKADSNAKINNQHTFSKSSEHIYSSSNTKARNAKTQHLDKYSHLSKSTESLLDSKNIGESIARTNKQLDKLDKQLSKSSESISNSQTLNDVKGFSKKNEKQNQDEFNLKLHKDADKPPTGKSHKSKSNDIYYINNESLNQSSFHTMFTNAYVDLSRNTSMTKLESSTKNEKDRSKSKQSNDAQHITKDSPKIKRNLGSSNLYNEADVGYSAKGSLIDSIKTSMIQDDQANNFDKYAESSTPFVRYNEITKSCKNTLDNKREFSKQSVSAHSRRKNSIENVSMKSALDSPTTQRKILGSSPKITRKTSWTYTPVKDPTGIHSTPSSPITTRNQRSPSLISDLYKKPNFSSRTSETYNSFPKTTYPSSTNVSCETPSVKRNIFARKYSIPFLENMTKSTDPSDEKSSPFSSPKNIRRYFKRAGSLPASSKSSNGPVKRLIEHFSSKIKDKDSNKKQKKKSVYSDPIIDFKDESESDCDSSIIDLPLQYFIPTIEEMPESQGKHEPSSDQWRRRSSDCSYNERGQWPRWSGRGVLTIVPIPDRLGPKPDSAAQYLVKSGLLMSVIRTLSASESTEQRDREKARLEKEYRKSDSRLDHLITNHDESLKDVMQIFGVVSGRLSDSRERIRTIKENLAACKRLLHCKRDELKERWLEGVEHKHVMLLLEQIDEVRDVGDRVGSYVTKKHYLHATQLLVTSLNRLGNDLKMVDALKEVNSDLHSRKEKLHGTLIEELHVHLYQRWTREVLALRRQGSGRESMHALSRTGSDRASIGTGKSDKTRKNLIEMMLTPTKLKSVGEGGEDLQEDTSSADPEADSQHFMAILVECLALLGKLPEAVETIKRRMQKELSIIISRTSQQILEYHPTPPIDDSAQPVVVIGSTVVKSDTREGRLLQELLQVVFEQFRLVASAHQSVVVSLRSSADAHGLEVQLYSMADVWSKVQAALQVMLSDYLDMSQLGNTQQQTHVDFTEAANDISAFFSKKRQPRTKTYSLFRFEASYHAMTMNSYLMEQAQGQGLDGLGETQTDGNAAASAASTNPNKTRKLTVGEKTLVCPSSPHNITSIFNPLQVFIREIEDALKCAPGTHCTLYGFVTDYIKDAFLAQLHMETAGRLEQATKALDQWTTCKDPGLLKQLKVSRPLLQSTMSVWQNLEELRWLLSALPLYADHFVTMMCNTLLNYRETCQAAYRGITQPDSEDKRIISAQWAKDEDISRFLRDLPNWRALQAGVTSEAAIEGDENPEEVSERNRKEAEILTGNLGDQLIPQHEILADPGQLKTLAHLQESLEWFGNCIVKFATSLPVKSTAGSIIVSGEIPPVSDSSVQTLTSLAKDFEELAHTCLLVLHLEVRLHCFFYLLPVARGGGYASGMDSQEPDGEVVKLNRDLATIDDALTSTLQPRKCKYIFEGLGPLIANILMTSVIHIRRINENGIKKMCRNIFSLQQQLTNITMTRELALDQARQYYEMLYLTPEEILNGVMNRGKQFSELEYINIIRLTHRSTPGTLLEVLQGHLLRLSEILGDVGVTV